MVIPITPPTQECVVETGISLWEAKISHAPVAMITHSMPGGFRGGEFVWEIVWGFAFGLCLVGSH